MLDRFVFRTITSKRFISFSRVLSPPALQFRRVLSTVARDLLSPTPHIMSFKSPNTSPTTIPPSLIPPGWTTDPEEMADCSEYFGELLQMENYDIPKSGIPRALLADDVSGVPDVLVEISDPNGQHDCQYYIWNQLSDYVSRVLAPKTAKEIVPLLLTNGKTKEGLVIRKLESVKAPMGVGKPDKPY